MGEIAVQRVISDLVDEYTFKKENLKVELEQFKKAGDAVKMAATVNGVFGKEHINVGSIYIQTLEKNLLKSGWLAVYSRCKIARIATAQDKKQFEVDLERGLPELTKENIVATFGDYLLDMRGNVLRGLAEVFSALDPAYKSHEKVKVGVKGLPKRIIISSLNEYAYGDGWDKIKDVLNALAAYQGLPLVEHAEMLHLCNEGDLLENTFDDVIEKQKTWARGVWIKKFKNGNGHLYFNDLALADINRGLAEYYGDVLPDETGEKPTKKAESTAVSKDLAYYPTPQKVLDRVLNDVYFQDGDIILEPSCGCGRILDAVKQKNNKVDLLGVEFDPNRAMQAKSKGYKVMTANFLDVMPTGDFDYVIMNPPFAGKHYVKHIDHAMKFLKDGGRLVSILPITAKADHGILDDKYKCAWYDLPFGSFRESGTNINTTIVIIDKR